MTGVTDIGSPETRNRFFNNHPDSFGQCLTKAISRRCHRRFQPRADDAAILGIQDVHERSSKDSTGKLAINMYADARRPIGIQIIVGNRTSISLKTRTLEHDSARLQRTDRAHISQGEYVADFQATPPFQYPVPDSAYAIDGLVGIPDISFT